MHASIIDCHTHTNFSDGESSFEENVRAAAARGCRVLVSTDHLTLPASMDPRCECQVPARDLPAHQAAFDAARELAAQIAPRHGFHFWIRCDWYPGCERNVAQWAQKAQVKLGSVHWIGDAGDTSIAAGERGCERIDPPMSPASPRLDRLFGRHAHLGRTRRGRRVACVRRCVVRRVRKSSRLRFDGPPRPAMRFLQDGWSAPTNVESLWDEMAACAHDTNRRIELSTASLRKGLPDYYPATGLLERFFKAGVSITIGSDAHIASDICFGILEAQKHAFAAGYRTFDVPRADGSWESWNL